MFGVSHSRGRLCHMTRMGSVPTWRLCHMTRMGSVPTWRLCRMTRERSLAADGCWYEV
ncbi:MAG: hypothetical protein IT350_16945 [Deltaproteobacteria bacterium]|nr:hypothetical protein [Deltaproteobacteria bacterium]